MAFASLHELLAAGLLAPETEATLAARLERAAAEGRVPWTAWIHAHLHRLEADGHNDLIKGEGGAMLKRWIDGASEEGFGVGGEYAERSEGVILRADHVTVEIREDGETVRTLARGRRVAP